MLRCTFYKGRPGNGIKGWKEEPQVEKSKLKQSLGYQPKDPNISQYLNCVMNYVSLQELKWIPYHKDQGAKVINREGSGALCAKGPSSKGLSTTEEWLHMPKGI